MSSKASILSTVLLEQPLKDKAAEKGIELDAMPFIKVEAVTDTEVKEEVEELCILPLTAVFTSANAVLAISEEVRGVLPDWSIYCLGHATKNAVHECFGSALIQGIAGDAAELAELIIADGVMEVVFFCGDKRMDTLPDLLREEDITVYELVVYRTTETPQVAAKSYDGVLFFSPSAVSSFFKVNTVGANTVFFSVGNTTAEAVKQHTDNKVIISDIPSKEEMINAVLQYFL